MLINKLLIAACIGLPAGMFALAGGGFLTQRSHAQDLKPATAAESQTEAKTAANSNPTANDPEIDKLIQQLLEAARQRIKAQQAYYEEGRITVDRFIDAIKQLEQAEWRAAKTDAERRAAMQQYITRVKEIEGREQADLEVGRGTVADVAEAHERHLEAMLHMKIRQKETEENASTQKRLADLERKVDLLLKERLAK